MARSSYHLFFRLQLVVRCWLSDRVPRRTGHAVPPALLRFRVSESLSVGEFDRIGAGCAMLVEKHLRAVGIPVESLQRVLDFGCGCGRVLRHASKIFPNAEFEGVDVDAEAIGWCKAHLAGGRGNFQLAGVLPPLDYPVHYFDAVYAISVFTHLNEVMQDAWLEELSRIVNPSGALLITVYGQSISRELTPESSAAFAEAGFAHQASLKLRSLVPGWYNTSWHSRQYIVSRLETLFEEIHYFVVQDGQQDVLVAQRPRKRTFMRSGSRLLPSLPEPP